MAGQTANAVVFKKNSTTYQVVSSTDEEAIKKILDIEDEISTLESNISAVTEALTTAQSKAVNKIVFCSEVPGDSIGSVNTLYLTRIMEGVTETTYTNTIEELPYVTSIEMSPSNPKEGDTVSITFYPDEQHGVDTSNVRIRYYLEDGTEAWVVPTANGTSSNYLEFIQPAGNCYIDGIIVSTILPGADEGTLTIGSMSVGSDSDPFDSDLYQLWGYTNHEYLKSVVRDHEITEDIGSCTLETKGIKCIYDISFWGGHAFDITIDKNNQYGIDDNCYLFLIADNPDNLSEFTLTWTDAEHYPDDMDQNTVEFGGPSVFDNYYLYRNTYSRVFSDNEVGKTYTIKVDKDAFSRRIKK